MFSWLFSFIPTAHAHVRYVLPEAAQQPGTDWAFLLEAATQGRTWFIALALTGISVAAFHLVKRIQFIRKEAHHIKARGESYRALAPWTLRISLGIALLGAAGAGDFLSPAVSGAGVLAPIELVIGFLLLIGFLTGPAALATIALWIIAIFRFPELLGSFEIPVAAMALILWGSSRPGADDLLNIPFMPDLGHHVRRYGLPLLRIGVGVTLMFLAVYEKLLNPREAAAVVELYDLGIIIPVTTARWVLGAGLVEAAVGLAVFLGWRTRIMSGVAFAVMRVTFFAFGDAVYAHVVLFGALSMLIALGPGKPSVDSWLLKKEKE